MSGITYASANADILAGVAAGDEGAILAAMQRCASGSVKLATKATMQAALDELSLFAATLAQEIHHPVLTLVPEPEPEVKAKSVEDLAREAITARVKTLRREAWELKTVEGITYAEACARLGVRRKQDVTGDITDALVPDELGVVVAKVIMAGAPA